MSSPLRSRTLLAAALTSCALLVPTESQAFCGFYVGGADHSLYANATMVTLMRDGNRTVLSMQNDYQGPPEGFAMVVPVPVVLHEEDVRTLPRDLFARIDTLAAPRLVEYWEHDPCAPQVEYMNSMPGVVLAECATSDSSESNEALQVRIEAQFAVGEYDIVILSAGDSTGLETWLHREHYNIPEGAGAALRPYVEAGTKFFVARVDPTRVTFENGRAVLSPLRFHYDSPEFWLPVRLGLLSSAGQQDLIVHILARNQRFEVANYANVTIPTNLRVVDAVRDEFGGFYEYVFRETIAHNPRTVVTEYAWDAQSCDPCPGPTLTPEDITTLGADVIADHAPYGFTLTRLHYRYSPEDLNEDLVFRTAGPIEGGRGIPDAEGVMTQGASISQYGGNSFPARETSNRFQGRYVILHPFEGEVTCESPQRGRWGGPPGSYDGSPPSTQGSSNTAMAGAITSAPMQGEAMLQGPINWQQGQGTQPSTSLGGAVPLAPRGGSCASCSVSDARGETLAALGILSLLGTFAIRRRRKSA